MGGFQFWHLWLMIVSVLNVLGSLGIVLLNGTDFFDILFDDNVDSEFFGAGEVSAEIYAVLGATMAG